MAETPEPPDLEVNLTFPEGLRVTKEDHPYHILFVSDLAGCEAGSLSGPLNESIVRVTAGSLDELMHTGRPAVSLRLTDPLASGNVMVDVDLSFESLKAIEPRQIAPSIPATRGLAILRQKIVDRLRGELTSNELSEMVADTIAADASLAWMEEALKRSPAKRAADARVVDDVLSQLDLGVEAADESEARPKTPAGRLVAAASGSDATNIPAEEASACRRALAELDRRISIWITTVLHSEQVQAVETAWRSLGYLVSQIDFRKGVRLSLLHASQANLLERFRSLAVDPVFDDGADAPDLIVVDKQFGNNASDIETLDELAQHAASLPAIVLTGASPQFFGVKHVWQVATLPPINNLFDQWQFARWKSLRTKPYARSLGVVFGRCLLRRPYARPDAQDLGFGYSEPCMTDKDLIWATGAVAAACTVALSVTNSGWPTAMSGCVHGVLEGFKTAEGGKKGDKRFGPTDAQLAEPKIEELGMVGINAAVAPRDHDEVTIWNGMTSAMVPGKDTGAVLEVSLPYQLFAGRLSALLLSLKPGLVGLPADKIVPLVTQHVRDWVPFDGEPTSDQVSVQTRAAEEDAAVLELAVTVTPPPNLLPGGVPMVMGYRLS